MKLYKKLYDIEEAIGKGIFTDVKQAEILQKQLQKSWNEYKELWEQHPSIVADLTLVKYGIKKKVYHVSYQAFRNVFIDESCIAAVTCFYQEISFQTNNVWENNRIW